MFEARSFGSRAIGLALLAEPGDGFGLLLPRCRTVHTFGMRFALDVAFLDSEGRLLRLVERVPRRRVLACARAAAVLETPSGQARRFLEAVRSAARADQAP